MRLMPSDTILPAARSVSRFRLFRGGGTRFRRPVKLSEGDWTASTKDARLRGERNASAQIAATNRSDLKRQAAVASNWQSFKGSRNLRYGNPSSTVGKRWEGEVAKGITTQGVKPVLARRTPIAARAVRPTAPQKPMTVVGKGVGLGFLRTLRKAPEVAGAAFKMGASGAAKPRMGLGAATALHGSKGLQKLGTAAKWTGENRGAAGLATGVVGGSVVGAGLARNDTGVNKAHGDPEDARYYRLGAESAGLGAAGAAGVAFGANRIRRDTRSRRTSFDAIPRIQQGPKPQEKTEFRYAGGPHHGKLREAKSQEKLGAKMEHGYREAAWRQRGEAARALEAARRASKTKGLVVHGRPAAAIGGGLAALGGAEALRRKATERRWN